MSKVQDAPIVAKPPSNGQPRPVPAAELLPQNLSFLALAERRIRELVMDGQKRRGDGKIVVEIPMSAGVLTGAIAISPRWMERLKG